MSDQPTDMKRLMEGFGALKDTGAFGGDGVKFQREMRAEWDKDEPEAAPGDARQVELRADMTDNQIEQEIQAKGLTAPRVTPAMIEANIASEHYFTAADGIIGDVANKMKRGEPVRTTAEQFSEILDGPVRLLTFCVLVLRNGFTVTGESACASPANFDAELGRRIAKQKAVSQLWPLMGYALKESLHRGALIDTASSAE